MILAYQHYPHLLPITTTNFIISNNCFNHSNPFISKLSTRTLPDKPIRRLKRKWPRDILNYT